MPADLDRPVWSALTTAHRRFAEGGALVRRYPAAIGPFAALADATPAAFDALRGLIPADGSVALVTAGPLALPPPFEALRDAAMVQMVMTNTVSRPGFSAPVVALGADDVPEMLRLTELTKPGPFGPRTHELGTYIGIRVDGRLVAMAGERMRLDGYVEVSAICVDPDHRGRGYAQHLAGRIIDGIVARGDVPFLHVFADNPAIALYRQLGFERRRELRLIRVRVAA